MKHEIIPIMAAVMWGLSLFALPAQAKYGGGTGELNDPYLILDANQMNAIGADSNDWDKCFKLMADIDLSEYTGTEFNTIGTGHFECPTMICWFVGTPFTGVFDGNGHTISNFTYQYNGNEFVGLFGCVDGESAQIKNLGLRDVDIDTDYGERVGSLIGLLFNGTVIDCYTQGGSVSGDYRVGGLVGRSDELASIFNCYADVNVSSYADVGGLVGTNSGTISNCYSKTSAVGVYEVGGLVGHNLGIITDCYLNGSVSGSYNVGGMVGENRGTINNCYSNGIFEGETHVGGLVGDNSGIITDCYSTGSVSGYDEVSGLVGLNWVGTITNCYTTCDVEGTESVGGLVGFNRRTVVNCYATGSVSGTINVGGLVGRNGGQRLSGVITNCYSAAPVMGTTNVGGLVGINEDGTVTFSFWDVNKSGLDYSDGGVGKTTADMQTMSTFTDAGWDFAGEYKNGPSDDWAEPLSGGYMILWWQLSPPPELPTFSGGTGEPNDPYLILTKAELNHIGHNPRLMSRHFKLIDDIDLTGTNFFIIGNSVFPFTGTFDGNGKTISNFIYRRTNQDETGFFTCVNNMQSQIKDLYLKDLCVEATNTDLVGALCGRLAAGTIIDCHTEGCSVLGKRYIGGLVGFNTDGTISNCTSSGSVSGGGQGSFFGSGYVGGLVGFNHGVIRNCFSHSSVISGSDDGVGGLVGDNSGIITDCYSTGSVSGDRFIGGLVGWNEGPICSCYSTGRVLGTTDVGGLVGKNWQATITYSFWDIETSGRDWSDGGTGLPTAEMQTMSTFTDAGWDFVGETFNGIEDIWFIPQGDYPHLWWEGMEVSMKLTPRTLNCRSKGNWVKAHLTLPQGFSVADVDPDRPAVLHSFGFESAPLYVFVNKNERVQIEAAFEREAVCSLAGDWPQALTVAGFLTDGSIFLGTSTVRMIAPGMKEIEDLASCWLQGDCAHPTWCDRIDMNRDSLVNLLDYALLLNSQVEFIRE